MVSMVEASRSTKKNNNNNDFSAMDPVVTKPEPIREGSVSSSVSTPDAEIEALTQDVTQTQKRKGGRKPVRKMSFCYSSLFLIDEIRLCFSFLVGWIMFMRVQLNLGPRTPPFAQLYILFFDPIPTLFSILHIKKNHI